MKKFLQVSIGDTPVGLLTSEDRYLSEFRLETVYLDDPNRPTLGQLFEDDLHRTHRGRKGAAPRWFGNLLPETGSRLRQYLGRVGGLEPGDDLGLLEMLGQDLPGAVCIAPVEVIPDESVAEVSEEPDPSEGFRPEPPPGLRISLAGIQLKFSVVAQGDRISLPAKSGEGNYILKVAGNQWAGLAANEAAMMNWANLTGFDVAEARIVPLPDLGLPTDMFSDAQQEALLVRRFDRAEGHRIHQEDLAQVTDTPVENKYSGAKFHKIAPLIRNLLGDAGLEEYLRRLTLMVAQGNADAHLKNWSIRYTDGRTPTWSPLYDQVSTIGWPQVSADLALELSGIRHLRGVTLDSLEQVAKIAGYPGGRARELVAQVIDRLRSSWPRLLEDHPLPPGHQEAVMEHWRSTVLLRSFGGLEP